MAKAIMIQGTMSSAGKSYIVTGLCRYYTNKGYRVAPFKSQNMALNSYVTDEGLEMGRAQVVQAEACNKKPSVLMNPVLLKPTTDVGSQVIVYGKAIGNMRAKEYFEYKKSLVPLIKDAFDRLSDENDLIIIEGAGSPAEINLRSNDIVNMGLAEMLDVPVILVGDIDPGGVFAQLYGTLELVSKDEKDRIKGLIINKFRGDKTLLEPGIQMLEEKCKKKVIGVVPMSGVNIEQEDSITSAFSKDANGDTLFDIAIIKLPRISNFTDFDIFKTIKNVSVRYVEKPSELKCPDLMIIPGTKSTIADLVWLKECGLFNSILGLAKEVPVIGICGGYQMLGLKVSDPYAIEGGGEQEGLGLISMETTLDIEKTTRQISGEVADIDGIFSFLNGKQYSGYEIHNGQSTIICENSSKMAYGTYIHGFFDEADIAISIVEELSKNNIDLSRKTYDYGKYKNDQYDLLAESLEDSLDFQMLDEIIGL